MTYVNHNAASDWHNSCHGALLPLAPTQATLANHANACFASVRCNSHASPTWVGKAPAKLDMGVKYEINKLK